MPDLGRHLQGRRRARGARRRAPSIVNDVSGLRYDPALAGGRRPSAAPALVLMHTRGRSDDDVRRSATTTTSWPRSSRELAASVGRAPPPASPRDRIIVDPGIGFAKRPAHSYGVLARLAELAAALDRPLLVGPSRKSFMREALGDRPAAERDWGTAAAVTAAVLAGAHIVRVHAVAEMVQVVRVAEEIDERSRRRRDRAGRMTLDTCELDDRLLRRPPIDWWDLARHPRGVGADLRGPQADSRHARRADGARRRRPRRAVLRLAVGATSRPSTG